MVNFNFASSRASNIFKFGSDSPEGFIQINNNYTGYTLGTSNNYFYIKNLNDTNNNYALTYDNNILNVSNINLYNINNNNLFSIPNSSISLSSYIITSSEDSNIPYINPNNIFNSTISSWNSANNYNNKGIYNGVNNYGVISNNNTITPNGTWIKIILPLNILLDSIKISYSGNTCDPSVINLYGLNQYTNNLDVLLQNQTVSANNINIPLSAISPYMLYNTFVIIITNIINTSTLNAPVIISKIFLNSKSPININNYINIAGPNIYNVNSINLNEIILNNTRITNFSDITNPIVNSIEYHNMLVELTGAWSNVNNIAHNTAGITNFTYNLSDPSTAIANFDINGSINFTNKFIKKCININTFNFNNRNSLKPFIGNNYIKICNILYNDVDYFKLKIYSYEYFNQTNNSYYSMQEIIVYGIFNNSSPIYYENFSDNTNTIQRISGVYYNYNDNNSSSKLIIPYSIDFYIQINPILNCSSRTQYPANINNYIYVDFINTYNSSNIFTPIVGANISSLKTSDNNNYVSIDPTSLKSCILNSERIITNTSCNILKNYNNLYADNFILNTPSINNNNVLINDYNGAIVSTTVSATHLQGLSNISLQKNYYKIPFINTSGILDVTNVTSNQINALNTISTSTNNLIPYINSQGLLTTNNSISINKLNILNNSLINSFVITGNDNLLTTLQLPISATTVGSLLTLFQMSNPQDSTKVYTTSNIAIGTTINPDLSSILYINGSINISNNIKLNNSLISWNNNLNLLQVNNSNISDDILKNVVIYPLYDNNYDISVISHNNLPNNMAGYYIESLDTSKYTFNNPYSLTLSLNDYNFSKNTNQLYNIITNNFNPSTTYWKSNNNYNINNINYVIDNIANNPVCGTYFTFALPTGINIILVSYLLSSKYISYINTINSFNIYGYNITTKKYDLIDSQSNITNWNINGNQKIFNVKRTIPYNKFAFCINKINNNSTPNFAALYSFSLSGISTNGTYVDNNTNIVNTNNNPVTFNNIIGINNYYPSAKLSIGPDLLNSPIESSLNINDGSNINLQGARLLNLTKPSNDPTNIGVRASHILNNWISNTTANTRYDINLTHNNFNNENMIISMLSDGRIGFGGITPDISQQNNYLSSYSNIYLYNTNSKYISIGSGNITKSYSIIFPESQGLINNFLAIQNIDNSSVNCTWSDIRNIFKNLQYCKIGADPYSYSCNIINQPGSQNNGNFNNVSFQIDGKCIIANNSYTLANGIGSISSSYINNNSLIVIGSIYTTQDITTDSDISYKYNLEKILNPIEKIKQLNGYTFNRNDTEEGDNKRHCGLIAQEVQKIMPEAIITKHDGKLRVVYNTLAGLYVEGFKELNQMIEYQNFKINILIVYNIILLCFLGMWHLF